MNGVLVLSLDFELHWGAFEKRPAAKWKDHYLRTRALIPGLLNIFETHAIEATWATVGLLMHADKREVFAHWPEKEPAYGDQRLSPYHYIRNTYIRNSGFGRNEEEDPLHFGAGLVRQIQATPGQEIATHTFGHYYCNEAGQTEEQFRADLHAAKKAAENMDVQLRSMVLPRNQYNADYLEVCREEGIIAVRSNPDKWFWRIDTRDEPLYKRMCRGVDAYWPAGASDNRYQPGKLYRHKLPLLLPASRLLRAHDPRERFLNTWKQRRIFKEMEAAARENAVYHLWWHPHNFASHPAENLELTERICDHARLLGLRSMSMGNLADHIIASYGN